MIRSLITFALTGATLVGTGMLAASQWGTAGQQENSAPGEPYQTVLAMAPRGYWPADEGQGVELRDRSGNEFHGRINHVAWQSDMLDFRGRFEWLEIATPTAFAVDEYSMGGWLFVRDGNFQRQGMLFMGLWDSPKTAWRDKAAGLRIRENRTVEVFSNGQDDVLKSMAGQQAIPQAAWVHVLYTYSKGTGTLYLDGRPALSRSDVPFTSAPRSLFIGCDASWWMLHPPGSRSLDGSVRQLVFFDRVLKPDEVVRIVAGTRPDRPLISAEEVADQNGTGPSVSQLLDAVQDENMPVGQRALAALALAKMNGNAVTAVSVLVQQLSTLVEREGARLPRVEDLFRNALIKALQDIDPSRPDVRALLARTLIAPALATLDLSDARLRKVRTLRDDGKYFEALDEYQQQRKSLSRQRFFSFGDRHRDARGDLDDHSYTALAERDGTVYKLGAGKGYEGVEAVSPAEFERAMSELAGEYPAARTWRKPDSANLARVKITRTDAQGNVESVFLGGSHFILDGSDEKLKGWSIAIDREGYLHILGGQHNEPDPAMYIPGSWEKAGLSRDIKSDDYPAQMYWVSTRPGDITSLEFAGRRKDPRRVPVPLEFLNYMNFTQDLKGELYLYGRTSLTGVQTWGLYRYVLAERRWRPIDGDAVDVLASADASYPQWRQYLVKQVQGLLPSKPGERALVWAWQPHFYNYCRSTEGIRFDRSNRMHLLLPIRGIDKAAYFVDANVYAYSDDGGQTFHRADGSPVLLPLTVNPAPEHNASMQSPETEAWWQSWTKILSRAGLDVD